MRLRIATGDGHGCRRSDSPVHPYPPSAAGGTSRARCQGWVRSTSVLSGRISGPRLSSTTRRRGARSSTRRSRLRNTCVCPGTRRGNVCLRFRAAFLLRSASTSVAATDSPVLSSSMRPSSRSRPRLRRSQQKKSREQGKHHQPANRVSRHGWRDLIYLANSGRGSKLAPPQGAPLECGSLLSLLPPWFDEACFAMEFGHFTGTEARVPVPRAEGPAANSHARQGVVRGEMTWRSEGPAQNLCRSAGPSALRLRVLLPPGLTAGAGVWPF